MDLSVVIPCYNSASTIGELLGSLASQTWWRQWEVIVVDNRSDDGSMAVVEQYMGKVPGLRIVRADERRGKSYARNAGVTAAKGESIAFCDADDAVGVGWLQAMGMGLSRFDCVACRVDYTKFNEPHLAEQHSYHEQHHGLQKAWYPPFLEHAGGGTLGIRRALHEKIGGFDEAFTCLQDTEYCFRVQLAGYRIHWVPEAVCHVRCRASSGARFDQIRQWAFYNVLLAKRYRRGAEQSEVWKRYVKDFGLLLELLPRIRTRLAWERWVWYLGWQLGVLQGLMKFRTLPLSLPFRPSL